jgi:hypothetical protein
VLKSIPIFKGGHSKYVGWRVMAAKFLKIGFYSQETAFQRFKKTLEVDAKKVVELISVKDEYDCEDLRQSLEDEYGNVPFLAAEQKRKLTEMKTISATALEIFLTFAAPSSRLQGSSGKQVRTSTHVRFVSLFVSGLPMAYGSRLSNVVRLKKSIGLEATMEELPHIVLTKHPNKEMLEAYALKEQKKDKKKTDKKKKDKKSKDKKNNWQKKDKGSTVNLFARKCSRELGGSQATRRAATSAVASTTFQIVPNSRAFPSTNDPGRPRTWLCTSASVV